MTAAQHRSHRPAWRLRAAGMLALGVLLGATAPAAAQQPLPEDNAGTGQYVEPVPDAGGDRPARPGSGGGGGSLPPDTRAALPSGEEGRVLQRIAGEPGSGAPAGGGGAGGGSEGNGGSGGGNGASGGGARPATGEESPSAISAAASAASDPGGAGILISLVAALAAAFTVVALIRRRRSDS
ncbi:MAG TPA: hypothetical protein VF517_14390 [Thermoleophilaceae bacterium]|jgi:hypothetical protein